jgi:hypothetical protein
MKTKSHLLSLLFPLFLLIKIEAYSQSIQRVCDPMTSITTLSGLVYLFADTNPTRGKLIRDLHALEPDAFPLLRTDVAQIGPNQWFACVLTDEPVVKHTYSSTAPNGHIYKRHSFHLNPACFVQSSIEPSNDEEPYVEDLGVPLTLDLIEFYYEKTGEFESIIDHSFYKDGYINHSCLHNHNHRLMTFQSHLEHCCHDIHADRSCQKLSDTAIADILRLCDVFTE